MASEATYDVFLSYASPDKSAVAKLALRLKAAGLTPFLDKWHLVPGEPWQEALEEALQQSRTVAVFLGPSGIPPWQSEGLENALTLRVRADSRQVIPVLLPGAPVSDLPRFLVPLAYVDFRRGIADPESLRKLIAAITFATPRSGGRYFSLPGDVIWVDDAVKDKSDLGPCSELPPLLPRRLRLPRLSLPRVRLPRVIFKPKLKDVWLATAAPPQVARNSKFVARFSAYTEEYRSRVTKAVIAEAPEAKLHLDLHTCQWEPGTKVTVTLSAEPLRVQDPSQSFVWNGKWEILKFDVSVPDTIDEGRLILRFDVFVEGLKLAKLRPELKISQSAQKEERELEITKAPDKAFASYASSDRREVLGRIRSLQIFTRVDVFLDCLSIHPGESWKSRISSEILERDIFWLFWSRNALQSEWVEWEWKTALAAKTLDYIQPHPLEGPDIAPPPSELAALQFGTLYESFLGQMRSSWWQCRITQCRRAARRFVGSYWLLASVLLAVFIGVYFLWLR